MKGSLVVLLLALVCVASADRVISNVCGKNLSFQNLMLSFGSQTSVPSFQYWLKTGEATKYTVSFDRIYAFHDCGKEYKFSRQMLTSWEWSMRSCRLTCVTINPAVGTSYEQCAYYFDGNNGLPEDSPARMEMEISMQIDNMINSKSKLHSRFKFGVRVMGNELEGVLHNYNTFQVGFELNCAGRYCKVLEGHEEAYIDLGTHSTHFGILNNNVSLAGPGKDTCVILPGADQIDEVCGLHDFHLFVDSSKKPRLSVSWDNALEYTSLYFDPVVTVATGSISRDHIEDHHDDLTDGEIAGIVVGSVLTGVILFALLGLSIYLIHEIKQHHKK